MIRGTTPTITMKLPTTVSVVTIKKATFTIEQSGKCVIKRTFNDKTINKGEGNSVLVTLTQEESLLLSARNKAYVQLKAKLEDGTVVSHQPIPMVVTDIQDEEVLTDDEY